MLFGEADGHGLQEGLVDLARVDRRHHGQTLLGTQGVEYFVGVQEALFDQHVGQAFVALGLSKACLLELLGRQPGLSHEDLAEVEALGEASLRRVDEALDAHSDSPRRIVTEV